MASPISFTIELSRCWTTERVMGSILADIEPVLVMLVRAYFSERACDFRERTGRRIDDRIYIGIRHRGRQCHQSVARGQHAAIDKGEIENRLAPRLLLAQPG